MQVSAATRSPRILGRGENMEKRKNLKFKNLKI
jgi:hypothetical protein